MTIAMPQTRPASTMVAALAEASSAWPFEEARKLLPRLASRPADKPVLFETGYGPSGLPHIGTFGEVARTSMVRHAFETLTGRPTRLICFSDDMDGLRKVPDNVPNKEMLAAHIGKPLSAIPDPFDGKHASFAAHNNARLRQFLDAFGFEYEFLSATECYKAGLFDETLMKMLAAYDKVMDIILPTLGPDRRSTYSPFLPISPTSGKVLQVPMIERDAKAGTVVYVDPDTGERVKTTVTGGAVKCQWKADWALRWAALGVDYEMAGKDLIDSVNLSSKICRALGATPPEGFNYELFLDENGQKISKSKGNGITIEEWLKYAPPESLSLFMYQKPKTAKKLYFDVIPKHVDDYYAYLASYAAEEPAKRLDNPVWHIHAGEPPAVELPVSFALLLNLVSASNAEDAGVLWGFIQRYAPETSPKTHPELDRLVGYAIAYFHDFVKPAKTFREPTEAERAAILALYDRLATLPTGSKGEDIQTVIYEIGKEHKFEPLRDWFQALYEVLLGQSQGPRFGPFIEIYGIRETRALIAARLGLPQDQPAKKPKRASATKRQTKPRKAASKAGA